jgi:hypothetical protein
MLHVEAWHKAAHFFFCTILCFWFYHLVVQKLVFHVPFGPANCCQLELVHQGFHLNGLKHENKISKGKPGTVLVR